METSRRSWVKHSIALDGLRGLAVLAVIGYHFGLPFSPGGYLGVDIFFVLSGYLITGKLIQAVPTEGWFRTFWARRAARLIPVTALAVLVIGIIHVTEASLEFSQVLAMVGALTMSTNLMLLTTEADGHFLVHFWSLAVEFHFYLFAPLLALAARKHGLKRVGKAVLVAAATVLITRIGLLAAGHDVLSVYLNSFLRFDGVLLGAALSMITWQFKSCADVHIPTRTLKTADVIRQAGKAAGSLFALFVLSLFVLTPNFFSHPVIGLGIGVLAASLSVAGLIVIERLNLLAGFAKWLLNLKPLVWAGLRSYSLYIWHYIIGVGIIADGSEQMQPLGVLALQLVASLLTAELSYRIVEKPARHLILQRLKPDHSKSSESAKSGPRSTEPNKEPTV